MPLKKKLKKDEDSQKIIPKEVRPFVPYIAAAIPAGFASKAF